jgi:hypothetical protein
LIALSEPFAEAQLDVYRRSPARIPTSIRGRQFGGQSVERVYLYPPPLDIASK